VVRVGVVGVGADDGLEGVGEPVPVGVHRVVDHDRAEVRVRRAEAVIDLGAHGGKFGPVHVGGTLGLAVHTKDVVGAVKVGAELLGVRDEHGGFRALHRIERVGRGGTD